MTHSLIGADRMCVSSDYPHFDSNFPNVSSNILKNCSRDTAAKILMGGAGLYGFTEADFQKADKSAASAKAPAQNVEIGIVGSSRPKVTENA